MTDILFSIILFAVGSCLVAYPLFRDGNRLLQKNRAALKPDERLDVWCHGTLFLCYLGLCVPFVVTGSELQAYMGYGLGVFIVPLRQCVRVYVFKIRVEHPFRNVKSPNYDYVKGLLFGIVPLFIRTTVLVYLLVFRGVENSYVVVVADGVLHGLLVVFVLFAFFPHPPKEKSLFENEYHTLYKRHVAFMLLYIVLSILFFVLQSCLIFNQIPLWLVRTLYNFYYYSIVILMMISPRSRTTIKRTLSMEALNAKRLDDSSSRHVPYKTPKVFLRYM